MQTKQLLMSRFSFDYVKPLRTKPNILIVLALVQKGCNRSRKTAITAIAINSNHSPALALKARTAWMAGHDEMEPPRVAGAVVHVVEGREIFAEGSDNDTFYKVISGVVRVCKSLND